jgi:Ubiquitin carboxyl-terminal hydrolase, family 1
MSGVLFSDMTLRLDDGLDSAEKGSKYGDEKASRSALHGNGHTKSNGSVTGARPTPHAESHADQRCRLEEQKVVDGWARLAPSSESLSAFVRSLGVEGIRVDQWHNIDVPESADGRVYGLIFLYKWRIDRKSEYKRTASGFAVKAESSGSDPNDVMFVNQFVNIGTATQAVVAALLNLPPEAKLPPEVNPGPNLIALREFCRSMTPVVRSSAVCSSTCVRDAHNAAAAESVASKIQMGAETAPSEDFWMYTVYVPGESGRWVYELDGCAREGAVLGHACHADAADAGVYNHEWVEVLTDPLERRVKELRQYRIPFQLYALVDDVPPRDSDADVVEQRDATHETDALNGSPNREDTNPNAGDDTGMSPAEKRRRRQMERAEHERLVASHDYEPFIVEMLKLMASKGELNSVIFNACKDREDSAGEDAADSEDDNVQLEGDDSIDDAIRDGGTSSENSV